MNFHFLHITINIKNKIDENELKKAFNRGLDWIHYSPSCWIVKTNSSPSVWCNRLKPLLGKRDELFIVKIDLRERRGFLSKWKWDWILKHPLQ